MVLLALVDANYRLIMADFGVNGRISDGGVLQHTRFFEKLDENRLHIPGAENVNNSNAKLPYVIVADDAFPLRTDMLKPFRQSQLTTVERKIYNYRLSRARRIVENCFGIMASRFRIFQTHINLEPDNITSVVMAACALHNFLMAMSLSYYSPPECFDIENTENGTVHAGMQTDDSNLVRLDNRLQAISTTTAKNVRDDFVRYFANEGQVPWQSNFIH